MTDGRSRNEQVSVDFRLYLMRRIPEIQRAIATLVEAFVHQADLAGQAVMPSYTHLRRAQPRRRGADQGGRHLRQPRGRLELRGLCGGP